MGLCFWTANIYVHVCEDFTYMTFSVTSMYQCIIKIIKKVELPQWSPQTSQLAVLG